jgi:hypothetical protein
MHPGVQSCDLGQASGSQQGHEKRKKSSRHRTRQEWRSSFRKKNTLNVFFVVCWQRVLALSEIDGTIIQVCECDDFQPQLRASTIVRLSRA